MILLSSPLTTSKTKHEEKGTIQKKPKPKKHTSIKNAHTMLYTRKQSTFRLFFPARGNNVVSYHPESKLQQKPFCLRGAYPHLKIFRVKSLTAIALYDYYSQRGALTRRRNGSTTWGERVFLKKTTPSATHSALYRSNAFCNNL